MSFENLNLGAPILSALAECGYNQATPIQSQAIPRAIAGKDLIATAQTGTGKTAAFILPSLQRLSESDKIPLPRVLVLTPTRELATQVTDAVYKYGKNLQVKTASILGGMPYKDQLRQLSKPVDIVVATPGRLMDHMERGRIDLSAIEILILDEADRMLDMGFIDDVEYIAKSMPEDRQTLLFTATMDARLTKLASKILRSPERIEVAGKSVTLDNIKQSLYVANDASHKSRLLQHFLMDGSIDKAIIFSGTKREADQLAIELRDLGHDAGALHGDMNQHKRNKTITQLKKGKIRFLVATDVAARGIDINNVTHVFNYDLPKFAEDYVHRIGRTGRAGKSGIAISLATSRDAKALHQIERFTGQTIARKTVEGMEPTHGLNAGVKAQRSSRGGERKFGGRSDGGRRFEGRRSDDRRSGGEKRFGNSSRPAGRSDNSFGARRENNSSRFSERRNEGRSEQSFSARKEGQSRFSERRADGSFATPRSRDGQSRFSERRNENRSEGPFGKAKENRFTVRQSDAGFIPRKESRFSERREPRSEGSFVARKEGRYTERRTSTQTYRDEQSHGNKRFAPKTERSEKPASKSGTSTFKKLGGFSKLKNSNDKRKD